MGCGNYRKCSKNMLKAVVTILAAAWVLSGCSQEKELSRYDAQFLTLFDTVTTITGYAGDKEVFTAYVQEFHDELEKYHQLYDIYHEYPEMNNISTINKNAGIMPVKVDRKIIDLLLFSKKMYEETGGKMNVAMGSVLSVWHDYRNEGIDDPVHAALPPWDILEEAGNHVNISDIVIDEKASTVFLKDGRMSLDIGAVAKGYAVEQVCRKLEADGFDHALVSVGGNIRAIGGKNDGAPWTVGIQNPNMDSEDKYADRVMMEDKSLVSSGSYQRYYTVKGIPYHHIINPDTLMPWNQYMSVSVLCRDSGRADALSTAVFNMDLDEGKRLIESSDDTEAMWILPGGEKIYSTGFDRILAEPE